jgi:uncharacterized protein (TIGR03083 family)
VTSGVPQAERVQVVLDPADTLAAYTRHRRRFASEVASLDAAALSAQSRCEEWTNADVLRHGADVDGWMQAIWTGSPLPFTTFDPVKTPHEFVVAGRTISDTEARDRFVASSEMMATDIEGGNEDRWGLPAFSPIGAVPWWLSALHVFYDSWMHERDVLLPIGIDPPVEDDEALPVLTYALGLAGVLITEPTDAVIAGVHLVAGKPPVVVTPVDTGIEGDVASVIDALSGRGDVGALSAIDPEVARRLGTLALLLGESVTA